MSKAARRLLLVAIAADVVVIGLLLVTAYFLSGFVMFTPLGNVIANNNPLAKQDILQATLDWGRLAPLPQNISDFDIQTEGSAFSREFNSSFVTDRESLDAWIQASPGLQDAAISGGQRRYYDITPGGGAQFAQVIIDFDTCLVKIHVYWS